MATGSPSVSRHAAAVAASQFGEFQRPVERHREVLGVAPDAPDLRSPLQRRKRRKRRDQFQRGTGGLLQGKTMAVGIEVVSPDAGS